MSGAGFGLGILGVGFATWGETLYVHGNVETGHVDVEFVEASSSDPPGTDDTNLKLDGGSPYLRIQQQDKDECEKVMRSHPTLRL